MDEYLRKLERTQDLDGLERLEETGVRSEFLEEVRARVRGDLLRVLWRRQLVRTSVPQLAPVVTIRVGHEVLGPGMPWIKEDLRGHFFGGRMYLPGFTPFRGDRLIVTEENGTRREWTWSGRCWRVFRVCVPWWKDGEDED